MNIYKSGARYRIIKALKRDGMMPFAELITATKLTAAQVKNNTSKAKQAGLIVSLRDAVTGRPAWNLTSSGHEWLNTKRNPEKHKADKSGVSVHETTPAAAVAANPTMPAAASPKSAPMSRPGQASAHWSKRPTGAKVHVLMHEGFRGTAVEVAAHLGISRMSAERQLNAMVSAGDGHIFDRTPIAKNGRPPAHYAYGPAPSDDDSNDSSSAGSIPHVIKEAIRQAERGHATRIIMSGIQIWHRIGGLDPIAIRRLDKAVRL